VQDREEELATLLDAAIEAAPGAVAPQLLKAEQLERGRDFDGAIAVYEALYAANSANVVVANNLASLLVTHRDDDESLARAYTISRRLRDIEVPAVQDTYGWIAFRRGEHEEALRYLEPAAQGLPDDPVVQYHLGMAYAALGRRDEAVAQLTRALEIAGADNPLPQFVRARETLAGLQGE
jgi:Flp pilus assembly protein TadD